MSDDTQTILSAVQAVAMLPPGVTVHTFRNPGGVLVGADWERADVIAAIHAAEQCELGGEMCMAVGHGLVVWTEETNPLFVETKKKETQ